MMKKKKKKGLANEYDIKCNSLEKAREIFYTLTPLLEKKLQDTFGTTYEVITEDLADICAAFEGAASPKEKDASLIQEFHIYKGWKEGAVIDLFWGADKPSKIRLRSSIHPKIEERLYHYFSFGPGMLMVLLNVFSFRFQFLKMLLWGMAGFIGGSIAYLVFAYPILRLVTQSSRADSQKLSEIAFEKSATIIQQSCVERMG